MNRDSSVCRATGYEPDGRGSISCRPKKLFLSLQRPDRLWHPPRFIPNRYLGFFHRLKRPESDADLHIVLRSRMVELYFHSLIRLLGEVLN
jgi:hypothetical protein